MRERQTPDDWDVAPEELARQVNVPVKTTAVWRSNGVGPAFIKVGRHVRYRQSDIDAWIASRITTTDASR